MDARNDAGSSRGNEAARLYAYVQQGPSSAAPISGADDLLGLFNLTPAYDRYVRPFLKLPDPPAPASEVNLGDKGKTGSDVKGKTKAVEDAKPFVNGASPPLAKTNSSAAPSPSPAAAASAAVPAVDASTPQMTEPDGGAGAAGVAKRAKMERGYGHWVTDVGGRNAIKKDHYLRDLLVNPEWQPLPPGSIKPLEASALGAAFTLRPGALAGFDAAHWVAEEGGPKRKAHKRKRKHGEATPADSPASSVKQKAEEEHRRTKRPRAS